MTILQDEETGKDGGGGVVLAVSTYPCLNNLTANSASFSYTILFLNTLSSSTLIILNTFVIHL